MFFFLKVEIVKRVDANVDSQVIVQKQVPHPHVQKQVTFSGSTGGNFFNDIFNVSFPLSLFEEKKEMQHYFSKWLTVF